MLTGGEALEDYAAGRARRDLSALLDRAPQRAHRLGTAVSEEDVPVELLIATACTESIGGVQDVLRQWLCELGRQRGGSAMLPLSVGMSPRMA